MLAEVSQLTAGGFEIVLVADPDVEALALETDFVRVDYAVDHGLLLGGRLVAGPSFSQLFLAFNAELGTRVDYSELSFGFEFTQAGVTVSDAWPRSGVRYISSDQIYIEPVLIQHAPDAESVLRAWSVDAGQSYSAELRFITPPLPPPVEGGGDDD